MKCSFSRKFEQFDAGRLILRVEQLESTIKKQIKVEQLNLYECINSFNLVQLVYYTYYK